MKDYNSFLQHGLRTIVHDVLKDVEKNGLTDESYYMISFQTPNAKIPDFVRAKYPQEITIVLQNQFQDLKVNEQAFSVTLSFGGIPCEITVPFDSLLNFMDPTQKFGLTLVPSSTKTEKPSTPQKAEIIDLASRRKTT